MSNIKLTQNLLTRFAGRDIAEERTDPLTSCRGRMRQATLSGLDLRVEVAWWATREPDTDWHADGGARHAHVKHFRLHAVVGVLGADGSSSFFLHDGGLLVIYPPNNMLDLATVRGYNY